MGQLNGKTESVEEQLERLLSEAESTVASLRRELAELQRRKLTEAEVAGQHAEIDRLAEHLGAAQVHWNEVRAFFEAALQQLVGDRTAGEPDGGPDEGDE